MPEIIKSISTNQDEILLNIRGLHCNNVFDCDITYGNGSFYKILERPKLCYDIEPLFPFVEKASSENLPLLSDSLNSIVFDPPFLTYCRNSRKGNGNMVMARRFGGYWRYDELETHYKRTLNEIHRILKRGGKLVFKCQNLIHNHSYHSTQTNVINWAKEYNFKLHDIFVLAATRRMPSPNRKGVQQHARIFHSYFVVLEKK